MSAEAKLESLGLELPPPPQPIAAYKTIVISGNMAYLSGHGPLYPDGSMTKGRLGEDLDVAAGYEAAKQTGLALLATLKHGLGSLDRVARVIKILGVVSCTADFHDQPAVINGCSELFRDIFGEERGVAARSAVGVVSLPAGWPVEIEAMFEIDAS